MASGTAFVVFVFPVAFTVVFGTAVLIVAMDELDREIDMWPAKSSGASQIGLSVVGLPPDHNTLAAELRGQGAYSRCGLGEFVATGYDVSGNDTADGSYLPCQSADPLGLQSGIAKNDAASAIGSLWEGALTHWLR